MIARNDNHQVAKYIKLQPTLELYTEKKGNKYGDTKKKLRGTFGESFRRPPLAEFGADAARSFADRDAEGRQRGIPKQG